MPFSLCSELFCGWGVTGIWPFHSVYKCLLNLSSTVALEGSALSAVLRTVLVLTVPPVALG